MDAWVRHLPDGARMPPPVDEGEALPTAWREGWRADPDRTALVDLTTGAERKVTRGDLDAASAAAAAALAQHGVGAGDRVLLSGAPSAAYVSVYIGLLRLGAVVVPANTAYTQPELVHIVQDCGVAFAVLDEPERVARLAIRCMRPESLNEAPGRWESDSVGSPLDRSRAGDLAMIAYTSGTTGRAKGAMLTHGNLLASARAVLVSWRWSDEDGLVLALPLFHLHGLGVGVNGALLSGGKLLLLAGFDPARVVAASARPDATLFFGVPTMYKRLADHVAGDQSAAAALSALRLAVSGSAPLSVPLWHRIETLTGQRVLERYGMTETVMNISNPYDGERRPGSVGLPLPWVEVRLDGGDTGEIQVRGPNVFSGYYGDPGATAAAFTSDGWFRTGDIGRLATDGYLSIVGRAKELIISGGYNVYPREVEEALERHPAVAEAVVVGVASEEWGESVTAFIVPADARAAPTENELSAFISSRLASYKKPRAYHLLDALPRNALGKVERGRLVELRARGAER